MTAENAARMARDPDAEPTWRELARRKGVGPVLSVHDMARPNLFGSVDELDAFLAHVAASRRADLA